MIKEIFLPEKIGEKRLYSQRILGFSIQENTITCAQIYAKRAKNFVEKLIEQKIEDGDPESYNDRTGKAITKIIKQVDKYDQIRISIPASLIVFKELEVPFKNPEKIRMILDYEIEPQLPFSVDEAIIDFIITKQEKEENKTQILVAAVRHQDLQSILNVYTAAGIEPTHITIDLFAIYGLYQQIPEYQKIENACVLIDLGAHETQIAFLQDKQLRLTRIIPRGVLTIAKSISDEIKQEPDMITQKFLSNGFQKANEQLYDSSMQKHVINFLNDIQFTLNSFGLKLNYYKGIGQILFTGPYSHLKDLARFTNDTLQIPCAIFACEKIFDYAKFKNKVRTLNINWHIFSQSLGTAIPSEEQNNFDLRRKDFALPFHSLISKQLAATIIIIILAIGILSIRGYLQISALSKEISKIEKREISKLKKIFPKDYKIPKHITFRSLVQKADVIVAEKLELWAPFAKARMRPLEYMQELTNIIDKRRFDVSIEMISITEEESIPKITVEGFFRSKTGADHFTYFTELEKRFTDSKLLTLWNENEVIESRPSEDKGIKFTAKLKPKEV
jgi:type IV pilus assembly protein PilM